MSDKSDWLDELVEADRINSDLRDRITKLKRENAELRLAANLPTNGKITTLVGVEPSRLRELELCERRWETCERLAEIHESLDGMSDVWCVQIVREEENTFAAAVDNASREGGDKHAD